MTFIGEMIFRKNCASFFDDLEKCIKDNASMETTYSYPIEFDFTKCTQFEGFKQKYSVTNINMNLYFNERSCPYIIRYVVKVGRTKHEGIQLNIELAD